MLEPDEDLSATRAKLDVLQARHSVRVKLLDLSLSTLAWPSKLVEAEAQLASAVEELCKRNQVHGKHLTLDEILDPTQERQIGKTEFNFPGGDEEIVQMVQSETLKTAMEIVDDDADNDNDGNSDEPEMLPQDFIKLCKQLEQACISHADVLEVDIFGLQKQLRLLWGHSHCLMHENEKQTTLDTFFKR